MKMAAMTTTTKTTTVAVVMVLLLGAFTITTTNATNTDHHHHHRRRTTKTTQLSIQSRRELKFHLKKYNVRYDHCQIGVIAQNEQTNALDPHPTTDTSSDTKSTYHEDEEEYVFFPQFVFFRWELLDEDAASSNSSSTTETTGGDDVKEKKDKYMGTDYVDYLNATTEYYYNRNLITELPDLSCREVQLPKKLTDNPDEANEEATAESSPSWYDDESVTSHSYYVGPLCAPWEALETQMGLYVDSKCSVPAERLPIETFMFGTQGKDIQHTWDILKKVYQLYKDPEMLIPCNGEDDNEGFVLEGNVTEEDLAMTPPPMLAATTTVSPPKDEGGDGGLNDTVTEEEEENNNGTRRYLKQHTTSTTTVAPTTAATASDADANKTTKKERRPDALKLCKRLYDEADLNGESEDWGGTDNAWDWDDIWNDDDEESSESSEESWSYSEEEESSTSEDEEEAEPRDSNWYHPNPDFLALQSTSCPPSQPALLKFVFLGISSCIADNELFQKSYGDTPTWTLYDKLTDQFKYDGDDSLVITDSVQAWKEWQPLTGSDDEYGSMDGHYGYDGDDYYTYNYCVDPTKTCISLSFGYGRCIENFKILLNDLVLVESEGFMGQYTKEIDGTGRAGVYKVTSHDFDVNVGYDKHASRRSKKKGGSDTLSRGTCDVSIIDQISYNILGEGGANAAADDDDEDLARSTRGVFGVIAVTMSLLVMGLFVVARQVRRRKRMVSLNRTLHKSRGDDDDLMLYESAPTTSTGGGNNTIKAGGAGGGGGGASTLASTGGDKAGTFVVETAASAEEDTMVGGSYVAAGNTDDGSSVHRLRAAVVDQRHTIDELQRKITDLEMSEIKKGSGSGSRPRRGGRGNNKSGGDVEGFTPAPGKDII